jgi:hypothetical protein
MHPMAHRSGRVSPSRKGTWLAGAVLLTDSGGVVFRAENEFGRSVPDSHYDLVSAKETVLGERLVP